MRKELFSTYRVGLLVAGKGVVWSEYGNEDHTVRRYKRMPEALGIVVQKLHTSFDDGSFSFEEEVKTFVKGKILSREEALEHFKGSPGKVEWIHDQPENEFVLCEGDELVKKTEQVEIINF